MKEVSLEDLQKYTFNNSQQQENENILETPQSFVDNKQPKVISTAELSKKLKEQNNIEDEKEPITETPIVKNAFSSMLNTIENKKKRYEEEIVPIIEKNREEMEEAEMIGIDPTKEKLDDPEVQEKIRKARETKTYNDIGSIDTSDLNYEDEKIEQQYESINENISKEEIKENKSKKIEVEEDEDLDSLMDELKIVDDDISDIKEEETVEEIRSRFKESLSDVKITKDAVDFTKFKVVQKAISFSSALSDINAKVGSFKKADWVLYHTGRSITFAECKGTELNNLRKSIDASNEINSVISSLRFIYDHVIDANKPQFEQWCKLIRTEDIESLYFGLYRACYADSNIVPRSCTNDKCGKTSLINTNIKDMVKYENDEVKEQFNKIFNQDTTTSSHMKEAELFQISDDLAISYNYATLYSTFLQYASLPENITKKYSDTLNTMAYIDGFFKIDHENSCLIPIEVKTYKNNLNKTITSKLKTYIEILKTLTNDQYNVLMAKLNSIIDTPKISYIYPETTCPECGDTIPETAIESVLRMLFTRAQLVQVKSL